MAKGDTKLGNDLEHVNRRIQGIKLRLHDSAKQTKSLAASLKVATQPGETRNFTAVTVEEKP